MAEFKSKIPIERILDIVKSLYASEELKVSTLSEKYNVCEKTIRRDLQKIKTTIPLVNKRGLYSLDTQKLHTSNNTFQQNLLSAFASNADLLLDCFDKTNLNDEKIAFAVEYNHLPKKLAKGVMECIEKECKAEFVYKKPESSSRRVVSPIKFYTERERWYLLAKDDKDGVVKTFYFGKIFEFKALKQVSVTLTKEDIEEANNKKSVWSDSRNAQYLVRVYVKPQVAEYFLDGKLHKSQVLHERHHDGGLEVHYTITHKMEILPKIKGYIPHLFVLEPKWLWEEIMRDLEYYKDEDYRVRDI